ncbi:GNAT family N-acetyltransferase [Kribbella speibonae]|uniref:N-acetyltransferase n=1 Tax=Kribbella speibonae TaxID=1572660 RepID=A0ABY2A249_9ACTN|nr:GNAT family protein [Kribbella speibonae]TCC22123.1 N-acetyltransferase [Kribbella speibonae]
MTVAPDGRSLRNDVVSLDRLVATDIEPLYDAIAHEEVYATSFGGGPAGLPATAEELGRKFLPTPADRIVYVVRLAANSAFGDAGAVVGTTSLSEIDLHNESIHLGGTGYAPFVWGTAVNPACKLLLLEHAFEVCGFGRVKIQTGSKNTHSQAAIAKLGATQEGVLRRHMRLADGSFRDTVVFSILADEWPDVRKRLEDRISR